jgi:hypothetical protein
MQAFHWEYFEELDLMARGSYRQVEATAAKTGEDKRRTQPKDQGPYSVAQIDALYKKDAIKSNLNTDGGDGLQSKELHDYEIRMQQPQALGDHDVDGRLPDYLNDVPEGDWRRGRRGAHKSGGAGYPCFDQGKLDPGNQPGRWAKGGGKLKASGKDETKSPFSRAHKTWSE